MFHMDMKTLARFVVLACLVAACGCGRQGDPPAAKPNAAPPATAADTSDWPMFRGNPQLTGVATGSLAAKLELAWTFKAEDSVESSAAIVGNTVFIGSDSNALHALDLATGKLRWTYRASGAVKASPAVSDGVVFVGDDSGEFHAVNAATGRTNWTFKAEGEILSSANCVGDRVLFGSYDENLYCLNAADGKLVWKFQRAGRVHATDAVVDGEESSSG